MGSGEKRDPKDTVILKTRSRGGQGGGGQSGSSSECPVSLVERISDGTPFKKGTRTSLAVEGDGVELYAGIQRVGKVSARNAKRLIPCIKMGLMYGGVIAEKDGRKYVEIKLSG